MKECLVRFDRPRSETPRGATLPQASQTLTLIAQEILEHAAALLALREATLVSLALTPRQRKGALSVVLFDRTMAQQPVIASSGEEERRHLAAARLGAAALFEELRPRWPVYAPPPRLGIITDGRGLGFAPRDPWPLSPGWFLRQISGESDFAEIIPFPPHSRWAMLSRPMEGRAQ